MIIPAPLSQGLIVILLFLCSLISSLRPSSSSGGRLGLALFLFSGSSISDLTPFKKVFSPAGVGWFLGRLLFSFLKIGGLKFSLDELPQNSFHKMVLSNFAKSTKTWVMFSLRVKWQNSTLC